MYGYAHTANKADSQIFSLLLTAKPSTIREISTINIFVKLNDKKVLKLIANDNGTDVDSQNCGLQRNDNLLKIYIFKEHLNIFFQKNVLLLQSL